MSERICDIKINGYLIEEFLMDDGTFLVRVDGDICRPQTSFSAAVVACSKAPLRSARYSYNDSHASTFQERVRQDGNLGRL